MTDKNDEMVWVLPRTALEYVDLPGAVCFSKKEGNLLTFDALLLPPTHKQRDARTKDPRALQVQAEFKRRGDVEEDPTDVQLIPYCVVFDSTVSPVRILAYNRGAKAGEPRLANQWSFGIGGHICPEDCAEIYREGFNVILEAARRELCEELAGLTPEKISGLRAIGLFYNEDTPVNAVHLGVALAASIDSSSFSSMGDGVETYRWVTSAELNTMELEGWSCTVRDYFLSEMLAEVG